MKKILEIVLWIAVIIGVAYLFYFRFSNPVLTETQQVIETWPVSVTMFICVIVVGYLRGT